MSNALVLALIPLALLSSAWVGYCWYDISRSDVKHLPKWAWALIVALTIPLGGIAYLLIGREQN
jgi:hypothetical protein